jgi:hypothetical protein
MPEPRYSGLTHELLRQGVATRYAVRLAAELEDHRADLEQEALASGLPAAAAAEEANTRLGDLRHIAALVTSRPELLGWAQRWSWARHVRAPLLLLVLIPIFPVLVCAERSAVIARWGVSVCFGAALTGALLFLLQLLLQPF